MVGQHALPSWLRWLIRIGPKILCLYTPPEKPSGLISDPPSPLKENTTEFASKEMQSIYEELKFISGSFSTCSYKFSGVFCMSNASI